MIFQRFRSVAILAIACAFAPTEARPAELSIEFKPEPAEKGMTFERKCLVFAEQAGRPAWVSRHKSVPADEWARSFLIRITDPSARNGRRPIIEGEIVFWHEANTAVDVLIDSASGSRKVASGWGGKAEWQTLRFFAEDAYLGARDHGNAPEKLQVDGFDIRINAAAGDFYLASVKLDTYDPATFVDYSGSLKLKEVTSSNGVFHGDVGKPASVMFAVENTSKHKFDGQANAMLVDWNGKAVTRRSFPISIPPGAVGNARIDLSGDLKADVYLASLELQSNDVGGARGRALFSHSFVVAAPDDLFIVFDREPISRGITMDPKAVSPAQITQGLASHPVWEAQPGSSALPWGRSFRFKVTDERFQKGDRPSVDVDVIYRQEANAPVNLIMDTKSGARKVADGWGGNSGFQRLEKEIDDAFLGGRQTGKDEESLDGFDLRINSYNNPLALRAVFLRGYATGGNVDFARMLRFEGIRGPRPILVSPPEAMETLNYGFRNLAETDVELGYHFVLTDWSDKELSRTSGAIAIPGRGRADIPFIFKTAGLRNAVYQVKLEVSRKASSGKPLFSYETNVGVSSVDPLKRATAGDFLYGIDSGEISSFDWFDYLGVDITRRFPKPSPSADEVAEMLENYERHGMTSMIEADPPGWNADPAKRADAARGKADAIAEIARRFKGRIRFYELGNEPDLRFFYDGPISDYVEQHATIARAILQADPDAVVMNGGLCFAGEEGDKRAREFIRLVPGDTITAWAYHGHGPGAGSERSAYNRIVDLTRAAGKDRGNAYFETESGVAAVTKPQQIAQAATCIQKMVFAQSVHMPAFFWFRNFITGGDWAYTNLKTPQEPRPVVLAYRNMVENLRGLRHSGIVDLDNKDTEAHYFESADGKRRAVVLWSNHDSTLTRNLALAASPSEQPVKAQLIDMLGNRQPADVMGNGTVPVTITSQPLFLTWDAPGAAPGGIVTAAPSLIDAPARIQLFAGRPTQMHATIRNPSNTELSVDLVASSPDEGRVEISPRSQKMTVPPNSEVPATWVLRAARSSGISWPIEWTAFLDVDAASVDLAKLDTVPVALAGIGGVVLPRTLLLHDNLLDLQKAAGGPVREKRTAVVFGTFESPTDTVVRVGAAADWWFTCSINGKIAYSTMDRGNGGAQTLIAHTFDLPFRKGKNMVAFVVLGGSMGFKLATGGPDELNAALRGTSPATTIELALQRDGRTIARQSTTLAVMEPPVAVTSDFWSKPTDGWWTMPLGFSLDPARLLNRFEIEPDSKRWYQGAKDLSGGGWIGSLGDRLFLIVLVADDRHCPALNTGEITGADHIEIRAAGSSGEILSAEVAAGPDGAVIHRSDKPLAITKADVLRRDIGGQTLYLMEFKGNGLQRLNFQVRDSDDTTNKQTLTWFEGWDGGKENVLLWYNLVAISGSPNP